LHKNPTLDGPIESNKFVSVNSTDHFWQIS